MTTYRVGAGGATVFDVDGTVVHVLPPGMIVVPGWTGDHESPAALHAELQRRRLAGYADKRIAPADYEDKAPITHHPSPITRSEAT